MPEQEAPDLHATGTQAVAKDHLNPLIIRKRLSHTLVGLAPAPRCQLNAHLRQARPVVMPQGCGLCMGTVKLHAMPHLTPRQMRPSTPKHLMQVISSKQKPALPVVPEREGQRRLSDATSRRHTKRGHCPAPTRGMVLQAPSRVNFRTHLGQNELGGIQPPLSRQLLARRVCTNALRKQSMPESPSLVATGFGPSDPGWDGRRRCGSEELGLVICLRDAHFGEDRYCRCTR